IEPHVDVLATRRWKQPGRRLDLLALERLLDRVQAKTARLEPGEVNLHLDLAGRTAVDLNRADAGHRFERSLNPVRCYLLQLVEAALDGLGGLGLEGRRVGSRINAGDDDAGKGHVRKDATA